MLSAEYTAEHATLQERLPKLEERLEYLRSSLTNVNQFVDRAKRYCSITELTPETLRLFIQKIVMGEKSQKYSRTAEQSVCIYYRDIGLVGTALDEDYEAEAAANECGYAEDTRSILTA